MTSFLKTRGARFSHHIFSFSQIIAKNTEENTNWMLVCIQQITDLGYDGETLQIFSDSENS